MSPDEREAWWSKLIDAEQWFVRSQAADALLDRVEQLERELTTAREAEHIDEGFKRALSRAYSRVEDLQAELAAATHSSPLVGEAGWGGEFTPSQPPPSRGRSEEPWTWLNYPDGQKLLSGPNRAVIHCPDAPMNVTEADQALIAAAPDLLAACKTAIAAYDEAYQGQSFKAVWRGKDVDAMRAAIARAESPRV